MPVRVSNHSLAVAKVTPFSEGGGAELPSATGFFCHRHDRVYFVTNWHVASGRHSQTKRPLHSTCAVVGRIDVTFSIVGLAKPATDQFYFEPLSKRISIPISEEILKGGTHPSYGSDIDIFACDVSGLDRELRKSGAKISSLSADGQQSEVAVAQRVTIAGFPDFPGLLPNNLPIYKSGTFASEPDLFQNGTPFVLIDGKTKGGWSGSPILVHHDTKFFPQEGVFATRSSVEFFGVYSGRLGVDKSLTDAELAIGWPKGPCLIPILDHLRPPPL